MNKLFYYLALALMSLLVSCKSSKTTKVTSNALKVNDVQFDYFKARGDLHFENETEDLNSKLNLRIKKDSLIWFSMSVMVEAVRGLVEPDSFFIYQRLPQKHFHAGSIKELGYDVNIGLEYEMMEDLLLGNFYELPYAKKRVVTEEDQIHYIQKTPVFEVNSYINKEIMKTAKTVVNSKLDSSYMTISYSDHVKIDDHIVPQKISIKAESHKDDTLRTSLIDIEYTKIEFFDIPVSMPFNKEKYRDQ